MLQQMHPIEDNSQEVPSVVLEVEEEKAEMGDSRSRITAKNFESDLEKVRSIVIGGGGEVAIGDGQGRVQPQLKTN